MSDASKHGASDSPPDVKGWLPNHEESKENFEMDGGGGCLFTASDPIYWTSQE